MRQKKETFCKTCFQFSPKGGNGFNDKHLLFKLFERNICTKLLFADINQ